jgi:hypothetical protein
MSNLNFAEWFCLKDGRKNFLIDPTLDRDVLFGQPEWEKQIDDRLRKSQLLSTPARLVWWGQYGIGKTHRLHHTEYLIKNKGYTYHPCYLVASDIQEKTGFEALHNPMVSALRRDWMRGLAKEYLLKAAASKVPPLSDICNGIADIEVALETFGHPSEKTFPAAWTFLCGGLLDKTELGLVGVGRPKLERAGDYAGVIQALATIIELETGKMLLYLIDEGENLTRITNRTAEARWNESLRAILDVKNLGVILTVGAEKSDQLPVLILRPDIVRRIQKDNYVTMESFKEQDTSKFIRDLLEKFVDAGKRSALEVSEGFSNNVPDYKSNLYPFTEGGFAMFCDGVTLDPRNAKPSEILAKLNNVAAEACFDSRRLINRDHLTNLGFA